MSMNEVNSESTDSGVTDVVIANRDGMPFLPMAVQSVLRQTTSAIRVHVVDGESLDDSRSFLASVADPRFSWSSSPYTLTPAARRNLGIVRTYGDYVMFLDSDDVLELQAVSDLRAALSSPHCEIAIGGISRFFHAESEPIEPFSQYALRAEIEHSPAIGNVLLRRSLLQRIGKFDESLVVGDFVEWMSRVRALDIAEQKVQDLVVWRREHARNWSRTARHHYAQDYPSIVRAFLRLREQNRR